MTSTMYYGLRGELIATDSSDNLVDVVIAPAGTTSPPGRGTFIIDDEAWKMIEAAFRKREGVDLLIDYEHQSVGGKHGRLDGTVPAAGWIRSLRYDPKVGIIASVEWTDEARKLIRTKQYKYSSGYYAIDKKTRRVAEIVSVAITNTPATPGIPALAAKKEKPTMAKKTKTTKKATLDLLGDKVRMILQEDGEGVAEEVVEQVDEVGVALAKLKTALGLSEATTPVEIINAAIAKVTGEGEGDGEGEGEAEEGMSALKVKLSLKANATVKQVLGKVDTVMATNVSGKEYTALKDRLETLESGQRETEAQTLVTRFVDEGRLNPNDKENMAWATASAETDPDAFEKLMTNAPVRWKPGQVVSESKGAGKSERQTKIEEAIVEFKHNSDKLDGIECWAFVNSSLSLEGLEALNTTERKALKV